MIMKGNVEDSLAFGKNCDLVVMVQDALKIFFLNVGKCLVGGMLAVIVVLVKC